MTLNEYCKEANEIAKQKGWWDIPRSPLEVHALISSEIGEATNEVRKSGDNPFCLVDNKKPNGEAVELIDAVIRIFDYFGQKGWDFDHVYRLKTQYNRERTHRHGSKKY